MRRLGRNLRKRSQIAQSVGQILASAEFSVPLTTTLVPRKGTGTASFTRATTKTFTDFEGVVRTVPSGCAAFEGARMVRNLLTYTEDFSNASWVISGSGTLAKTPNYSADPNGNTTACRLYGTTTGVQYFSHSMPASSATGNGVYSFYMKSNTASNQTVSLADGYVGTSNKTVTPTWQRFETTFAYGGTSREFDLYFAAGQSFDISVWHPQAEDVTGQSVQTAGEYVSVGANNLSGINLVTNGTFASGVGDWTAVRSATLTSPLGKLKVACGGFAGAAASLPITCVVGKSYTLAFDVEYGNTDIYLGVGTASGNANTATTSAYSATASGTLSFVATVTTHYLIAYQANAETTAGKYSSVDNISVQEVIYHGAGVDGVKFFTTKLDGSAIAASTLKGYSAEGQRTNLQEQSAGATGWNPFPTTNDIAVAVATSVLAPTGVNYVRNNNKATTTTHLDYYVDILVSANTIYTVSRIVKADQVTKVRLSWNTGSAASGCYADFDLTAGTVISTGTFGTGTYSGSTITPLAGGSYRISVSGKLDASSTRGFISLWNLNSSGQSSYLGVVGDGVYWTAAQVEAGAFASSYIPTTSAAVTRNADVLTYPSAGNIAAARQNLLLQSNGFSGAAWSQNGTPSPVQNVAWADGSTTAWTLTDNAATTEFISQTVGALTAANYTFSVFVKKTTGAQSSYPVIETFSSSGGNKIANVTIDTTNGIATAWTAYTAITTVSTSASCVSYNADYWRVSLTFMADTAIWGCYLIPAGATDPTQSTGVITIAAQGSAVFYGAQLELGTVATAYMPTNNLLTYSEDVSNAVWTLSGSASKVGSNQVNLSANGDTLAQYKTISGLAVGQKYVAQAVLSGTGTVLFGIETSGGTYENSLAVITLSSTPTVFTSTITLANASHTQLSVTLEKFSTTATSVTVTKAQLEVGTVATDYVATKATTTPIYQAGTIYVESYLPYLSSSSEVNTVLQIGGTGGYGNCITLFGKQSSNYEAVITDVGGTKYYSVVTPVVLSATRKKAFGYSNSSSAFSTAGAIGSQLLSDTLLAYSMPQITVGAYSGTDGGNMFGYIKNLAIFARKLPDSTLQRMTR